MALFHMYTHVRAHAHTRTQTLTHETHTRHHAHTDTHSPTLTHPHTLTRHTHRQTYDTRKAMFLCLSSVLSGEVPNTTLGVFGYPVKYSHQSCLM